MSKSVIADPSGDMISIFTFLMARRLPKEGSNCLEEEEEYTMRNRGM